MLFLFGMMVGVIIGIVFMCMFIVAKDSNNSGE